MAGGTREDDDGRLVGRQPRLKYLLCTVMVEVFDRDRVVTARPEDDHYDGATGSALGAKDPAWPTMRKRTGRCRGSKIGAGYALARGVRDLTVGPGRRCCWRRGRPSRGWRYAPVGRRMCAGDGHGCSRYRRSERE